MKKKLLSLALALTLCLSLTVPAFAAEEQKITVNDEEYTAVLQALMSEEEDKPVTLKLESDIQLTAAVVIGSSDYDGLFDGETMTVASHDVTIDLNGHALAAAKGVPAFEVQKDYKLTIVDTSTEKTGKLMCEVEDAVSVEDGGEYVPLTADTETPAEGEEAPAEAPEAPANPFTDVAETSPFYQAILWAVDQGITNGTTPTTFGPGNTCTVSHILTFLWRANGKPGAAEGTSDAASAAAWAVEQGMIEEGADVSAPCTRAMAVTFMWIAAGKPEAEAEINFTDLEALDEAFMGALSWALQNKVTSGTGDGTTFSPDNSCTRGQIVTFLYRAANAASASPEQAESGNAD